MEGGVTTFVPGWVPDGARRYLAHTEAGHSIRDLARKAGCHASTVMRQIRRIETRRDDPLVDGALAALASGYFGSMAHGNNGQTKQGQLEMTMTIPAQVEAPDAKTLNREAVRVLRRLCETGAVLAVAEDMDKAVVVRDTAGTSARTAVVDCAIAQAMALKDWITCTTPGRISRYTITAGGRTALSQLLAEQENKARAGAETGFAEAPATFAGASERYGEKIIKDEDERPQRVRYNATESPLTALARRKDRDGTPFLNEALVRAGERLREDFELAQMGPRITQNWDGFLTGGVKGGSSGAGGIGSGSDAARERVARALADLGPGLSDVVLRCCCYLEGLETAERKMGWSARSGKIVLRIALQRLNRHYDTCRDMSRDMIG